MSSAGYEPVATTEEPSPSFPPRSRKYWVIATVLFIGVLASLVAAFYEFGIWIEPSGSSRPTPPAILTTPSQSDAEEQNKTETETQVAMPHGKYSVGYFVNWGIYGRKFPPSSIPVQDLTYVVTVSNPHCPGNDEIKYIFISRSHILYAFANVRPNTGEVFLSDLWADQDIHYPGDSWSDSGTNLYGNFKAIYQLKKQHRHLKLLLSIGGWTYSPSFHPVVVSPAYRAEFVRSAVKLVEDYGLDGLDVDYEYPQNDAQATGYVHLLRELRTALDEHAHRKRANYHFLLTIAAPCGPDKYQKLHVPEMDPLLDFWNLMAYDFAGSWDGVANHQANVFGGSISASQAVGWYNSQGVPCHKIILGVPLYGRSFLNTDGPGTSYSGLGQGSWESGVYDYRALPLSGSYILRDEQVRASWTYDYDRKEMITFDDEVVGRWKGEYIAREGLGGSMFWELSGDKGGAPREGMEGGHGKEAQPGQSLVRVVKEAMGELDAEPNWLRYEGSKFENLKNGMPQ